LKVGDIIHPKRVINAGDGSSLLLEGREGVLVSFGSVAASDQKRKLRESFGAQAVDMEAASVLRAAEAHGITFEVVKAISDKSGVDVPPTERFVSAEGDFSEFRFALFAAIRPWIWPKVLRLSRNSNRASRALCAHLRDLTAPGMEGMPTRSEANSP